MTTIELVANDQLLQVTVSPKISSGEVNTVSIHVDFSDEWNNFGKNAVFYTSYNSRDIYEIVMTNDECIVPSEVMKKSGTLYMGIRGVNSDENKVKTTSLVKLKISEGTPTGNSTEVEPTPDVYQQLLTAYGKTDNSIKKEKAERQAEIAVERARIDNLSTLTEGSTTGDAELKDIRVGANGKTYPNAGEAVRGQIGDIGRELRDFEKVVVSDIRVQRKHQVGMYIATEIEESYTDYAVNSIAYPPGKYKVLHLASDTVKYSYQAEDIQGNMITGNTYLNEDTTFESDFDFFITLRKSKYPIGEKGITDSDLTFIDNNLVVTRIINGNGNTLEDRVKELEGSAVSLDETLTDPAKAAPADAVGELKDDIEQLKQNGTGTGTGLSTEAIDKLEEVGNYLVYTTADGGSKWTELIAILRNGSSGGGSGGIVPATGITLDKTTLSFTDSATQTLVATVEPSDTTDKVVWTSNAESVATVTNGAVKPLSNGSATITATCGSVSATCFVTVDIAEGGQVTLTSISATYTGGDVAVGTSLNDLTGITVTATYSDGSTSNVTGYTLSGTIAEGSNTITVSYGGKTTTFIVTGIVESGDSSGSTISVVWNDGVQINTSGKEAENASISSTDYTDVSNYSKLIVRTTNTSWASVNVFSYDSDKKFKSILYNNYMGGTYDMEIELDVTDVSYIRVSVNKNRKDGFTFVGKVGE